MNSDLLKKIISKIYLNKIDVFLFLLLLVIGIKYVFDISSYLDIELHDESSYLSNGVNFFKQGLPGSQWAPVYAIWYLFLSIFNNNGIPLYFLNLKILIIALPLLLNIFLRVRNVSQIISFSIGYFFLTSSGNILVHPKVSHFAILIILCSLILFSLTKNYMLKWSIVIIGSLLSAYVRPELFISFILIMSFFLFSLIKTKSLLKNFKSILKIGLIVLSIIVIIGNPLGGGGRAFGAFKQHFSLNWVAWNHSALNPWRDCDEIISNNFGNINNIPEALFSNTGLFFKHLSTNISIIYPEFLGLTSYTVFTVNNFRLEYIGLYLLLFIIIIYTLINLYRSKEPISQFLKNNLKDSKQILLISVFYLIPIISSIIIIYPRQHYLLFLLFFVIIILIPLIRVNCNKSKLERKITSITLIALAILLLIVTPNPKRFYSNYSQNNIETVKFLNSLNIKAKVNMLEDNGGYYTYLTPNYTWIRDIDKKTDFNEFLEEFKINMIILNGRLLNDKKFSSDTSFEEFLIEYRNYGFEKIIIPNSGNELLIKTYLINSGPK